MTKTKQTTTNKVLDGLEAHPHPESDNLITELNPWHDSQGKLSGPHEKDTVYSLSLPAVRRAGIDDAYAMKGLNSKARKGKEGPPRLRHKFGMPNKCGRRTTSGKDITPTQSCSKFPKRYSELREDTSIGDAELILRAIEETLSQLKRLINQTAKKQGSCSFQECVRMMDLFALSMKGKLKTDKPKQR